MSKTTSASNSTAVLPSLSFLAAIWIAIAIALVMLGYAAAQKILQPGLAWRDLFVHHLWHVVVLGGVIHLACWLVFQRLLGRPLNRIYLHLYGMGKGRMEPLKVQSNVRELRSIIDGINLLIWRMGRANDPNALFDAQERIVTIRQRLRELSMQRPEQSGEVTELLDGLERDLLAIAQFGLKQDTPAA